MTRRYGIGEVLRVLDGDRELFDQAVERGVVIVHEGGFGPLEVERARVARTLIRELEVNWEGTEIILRMREELLSTRRQVAELIAALRARDDD